jgi:hypothetical protein
VVEGARLESEYMAKPYRGFESLRLRQHKRGRPKGGPFCAVGEGEGENPLVRGRSIAKATGAKRRSIPPSPPVLTTGAGYRIRTRGPLITNQVLYQLS